MSLKPSLEAEFERHCSIIDDNDWSRNDRRKLKNDIKAILKRDGYVDPSALTPSYRWNLCSSRLRDGDFTNWDGWEFRSDWAMTFRWGGDIKSPIPKWDGNQVERLVVLGEQGIGDEILFLSALPDLMIRVGTKCIEFQTYPRLQKIVERSYKIRCTDRRWLSEVTEGDAIVALGDLFPWGRRDVSHFPKKPYLKPNPELVEKWSYWLEQFPLPWIGLGWHSRHGFLNPEDLIIENGTYFNLQYKTEKAKDAPKSVISPPFDVKEDFENLFAFVSLLSEVRSVTQTLIHVSGSVGTPTKAVIPPKNGEVSWHLWYHHGSPGKSWSHLVYSNTTVFESIDEFRNIRS